MSSSQPTQRVQKAIKNIKQLIDLKKKIFELKQVLDKIHDAANNGWDNDQERDDTLRAATNIILNVDRKMEQLPMDIRKNKNNVKKKDININCKCVLIIYFQ